MDVAKQCPWCGRFALKNPACNWVCCGLAIDGFKPGQGCGMQWCFSCSLKLCHRLHNPETGEVLGASTAHSDACCAFEGYCRGGHNSHKPPASMDYVPRPAGHADSATAGGIERINPAATM